MAGARHPLPSKQKILGERGAPARARTVLLFQLSVPAGAVVQLLCRALSFEGACCLGLLGPGAAPLEIVVDFARPRRSMLCVLSECRQYRHCSAENLAPCCNAPLTLQWPVAEEGCCSALEAVLSTQVARYLQCPFCRLLWCNCLAAQAHGPEHWSVYPTRCPRCSFPQKLANLRKICDYVFVCQSCHPTNLERLSRLLNQGAYSQALHTSRAHFLERTAYRSAFVSVSCQTAFEFYGIPRSTYCTGSAPRLVA